MKEKNGKISGRRRPVEKKQILIIEDDPNISEIVGLYLKKEGYKVDKEADGIKGYEQFLENAYDLMILDVMLPGMDGYEICQKVREKSNIPIIMLTAKGEQEEKIKGLEIGADDYLPKPFDVRELMARVRANLRRQQMEQEERKGEGSKRLAYDSLIFNKEAFEVYLDGETVEIPRREAQLLKYLMEYPNRVFSRNELIENIWGWDFEGEDRVVDLYIKRLRQRLSPKEEASWSIATVWGVGYKFEVKKN